VEVETSSRSLAAQYDAPFAAPRFLTADVDGLRVAARSQIVLLVHVMTPARTWSWAPTTCSLPSGDVPLWAEAQLDVHA